MSTINFIIGLYTNVYELFPPILRIYIMEVVKRYREH